MDALLVTYSGKGAINAAVTLKFDRIDLPTFTSINIIPLHPMEKLSFPYLGWRRY